MHLAGRTGNQLLVKSSVQLCLSENSNQYIRFIDRYLKRSNVIAKNELLKIVSQDEIAKTENEKLYSTLLDKHRDTLFSKRPASQVSMMEKSYEIFKNLDIEKQCRILSELLHLFQCNGLSADLKLLNGGSQAGTLKISNDFTSCKKTYLVYQSPTGLFQNKVDIASL
jgi:CRISPR-associated endonuclease Csn1